MCDRFDYGVAVFNQCFFFERKFSDGNNAAHDCSIGLSDHRVVDLAQTVHGAPGRRCRRTDLAVVRAARGLVSLVVVATNAFSPPMDNADLLLNQSNPRSRR